MNVLQISSSGAKLCDEHGDTAGVALAFSLGQHLTLEFDLRTAESTDGVLASLSATTFSGCTSYYFALSNVWNAATTPLFLRTSGITISTRSSKTILSIELPDTGVTSLITALSGKANAVFTCEIGGLDENALAVFVWQFQVTVHNRIYLGGDAPESVSGDPAYLTAAEVRAMIGERSYSSSDSIVFTGGTAPTATLKIHNGAPLEVEGGTAGGLKFRYGTGFSVTDGVFGFNHSFIEPESSAGTLFLHNCAVLNDTFTIAMNAKILFDGGTLAFYGSPHEYFTYGTIAHVLADNTTAISGGTVTLAAAAWTRYTGTCDKLAITSVPDGNQLVELLVTFPSTASDPDIGLPATCGHAGTLPTYAAGKTYIMSIQSNIAVAAEVTVGEEA